MNVRGKLGMTVALVLASGLAALAQGPGTVRQLTHGTLDCDIPDWNPDCTWVCFQREGEGVYAQFAIWKVNVAGTTEVKLTDETYYCDTKPVWGAKNLIAFQRNENTNPVPRGAAGSIAEASSIWVMNASGGSQRRLVKYQEDGDGGAQWPCWNPAGTLVAFKYGDENSKGLFWVKSDGTGLRNLGVVGYNPHQTFAWKPAGDGANVTIVGSFQTANYAYRKLARVSTSLPAVMLNDFFDNDYCQMMPAYNMAGTKVAYKDDSNGQGDIWVCKDNGKSKVQLTDSTVSGCCTGPKWFPDGRYIAYWSEEGNGGVSDKLIWIMTADGTHKVCAMSDNTLQGHYKEYDLRIDKKGSKIVFGGEVAGVDQIMVLDLDTGDPDGDGLKNWQEDVWGSDRNDKDSNNDGILDGASAKAGIDPV